LRQRLEKVRGGQLGTWREEVVAQAAVSAADNHLDDWVRALDLTLVQVLAGDRQSPRYRRYFSSAPSSIIRLGLENELGRVRGWEDSLAGEPEPALQALGRRLRDLQTEGNQALEQRHKAATIRTDHRVREIAALIDDINGARVSLFGTLTKKAAEARMPRDWPDRFFQHSSRASKTDVNPVTPNPPAAAS
jgi:hypothetical protein